MKALCSRSTSGRQQRYYLLFALQMACSLKITQVFKLSFMERAELSSSGNLGERMLVERGLRKWLSYAQMTP